jgi:hypothetical protein
MREGALMGLIFSILAGGVTALLTYFFGYPVWVLIILGVLWLGALVISFATGHHGFGGGGNTDLIIVIAALALTAAIVVPKYAQQTPCNRMRATLEKLDRFQKDYHTRNSLYASQLDIGDFKHDPDVEVIVIYAGPAFFVAQTSSPGCKNKDGTPKTMTWDSMKGGLQN